MYILLWVFFLYLYIQTLGLQPNGSAPNIILAALGVVDFGIHEISHIVFGFLPSIGVAAAGSIGEVSFTVLVTALAFKAKSYFAGIFGLVWVMIAMTDAGIYMADARTMQLHLVGPGTDPKHDWNYVFGQLGWLNADTVIGGTVRAIGDVLGAAGLLLGIVLIVGMLGNTKKEVSGYAK